MGSPLKTNGVTGSRDSEPLYGVTSLIPTAVISMEGSARGVRSRSAREDLVTVRFSGAEMGELVRCAAEAGVPLRTWMRLRLMEACGAPDSRTILREVRKGNLTMQRLWLAAAQSEEARAEILRIVSSVEGAVSG